MKKFVPLLLLAIAVGWINNEGPGSEVLRRAIEEGKKPFRIARLLAEEPDASLLVPVPGVSPKAIANTWHAPRGGQRRHEGQDIFAPKGTPVRSATRGVIVRIGENRLGGQTVSVVGPGGRLYYYAHLDRYAPDQSVGDLIERGTIIGYVGNTGNARTTPPHLHFGVYSQTGALNPLPLLQSAPRPVERQS